MWKYLYSRCGQGGVYGFWKSRSPASKDLLMCGLGFQSSRVLGFRALPEPQKYVEYWPFGLFLWLSG